MGFMLHGPGLPGHSRVRWAMPTAMGFMPFRQLPFCRIYECRIVAFLCFFAHLGAENQSFTPNHCRIDVAWVLADNACCMAHVTPAYRQTSTGAPLQELCLVYPRFVMVTHEPSVPVRACQRLLGRQNRVMPGIVLKLCFIYHK